MDFFFVFSLKDQDKLSAQQKSMREAEQERQWKQLQAIRAREQQLGIPPDPQRMQGMFNGRIECYVKWVFNCYLICFRS